MSSSTNQQNKAAVWDFWQKLNHVGPENAADVIRNACHEDIDWNGSAPIDQLVGVDALITGFWDPILRSFPDLKRVPYVFMGGVQDDESSYSAGQGSEWVSGCGYLTGTFVEDWLGIPATGRKTNIWFGQFYVMRDGKIAESYVMYDVLAVARQAGFQLMPPAPGFEGGKIPGPVAGDGILLTEHDPLEGRKTLQLVDAMGKGLERYVRDRDGDDMSRMEQWLYWDQDMKWYGPSGIGSASTLEEFADFHQRNWLHGFGDRGLSHDGGGRIMGFIGEGAYGCGGIWDAAFSHSNGEYAGMAPTGELLTLRDFDWWKRGGAHDLLIENWVPIDMIDLCRQLGVDLMDRLRQQVEDRNR